jgi:hypothetical protein
MDKLLAIACIAVKYIPDLLAFPVRVARMEERLNFLSANCPLLRIPDNAPNCKPLGNCNPPISGFDISALKKRAGKTNP